MWTTTTGTNLYVLDGGIARTHATIILDYRDQHAKPYAAAADVLVQHPGHGAGAEQPAWHYLAAV